VRRFSGVWPASRNELLLPRAVRPWPKFGRRALFPGSGRPLTTSGSFPAGAQSVCLAALTIAAEGGKADIAKPLLGLGSGVFEIALPFKGNAFRVVYAVQLAAEIWVVHAFQKKAKKGIQTPKHEIDLVKRR
jgi:phage-related protein